MNPYTALWKDKMDIWRNIEKKVNGITRHEEEKLYSNISCHLSKNSLASLDQGEKAETLSTHTLFCDIATDIKSGDRVVVTKPNGYLITVTTGEVFPYTYKLEVMVKRSDTA